MSRIRAGRVAAAVATAGLVLGGLLAIGGSPDAAQAAPVGCSSGLLYTTGGSPAIWERTASGADTLVATAPVLIGALAQDPVTGNAYVFGTATGFKANLYRLEADGTVTDLGPVAGLPNGPGSVFSAAFDHTGRLWAEFNNASTQLYPVDVAAMTSAGPLTVSKGVTNDIAELDGTMYSAGFNTLQRIDLTTGTVTSVPLPGLAFPAGPGLAAMDGHLYISRGTGFSEILNPTTATPTISATLTTGLKFTVGDAASCETAGNPFLNAEADDLTGVTLYSGIGGGAGNVFANDLLNGAAFQPADVTATVQDDGGLTGVTVAADGTLTVPAAAPAGTYAVGYNICQTAAGRTAVCDTATATVRVTAQPVVDAVDDDFTASPITAGTAGTAGNVFADDTVDGAAVTPADVAAIITADGGLTGAALTAAGDLTVPASAAPGTYTVAYQLCAVAPPTACDTATATVRVTALPVVDAVDDDFSASPITAGTAGTAGNVYADDTVDGAPATAATVTATIAADGGLTGVALTAEGDLTVPASAAPGTYAVAYQLCAVTAPTACDTATATVLVVAATVPVPPGTGTPGTGTPGTGTPGGAAPVGSGVTAADPGSGGLASTGSDVATSVAPALGGAAAVILGGALWLFARRRRVSQH